MIGADIKQHRRTTRLVWAVMLSLVALTVTALGFMAAAISQRNVATSRQLAANAMEQRLTNSALSTALAVEAMAIARTPEAESALRYAALNARVPMRLPGHTGLVYTVAFSPDGRRLVTAGSDKIGRIWDIATGRLLVEFRGHEDQSTGPC